MDSNQPDLHRHHIYHIVYKYIPYSILGFNVIFSPLQMGLDPMNNRLDLKHNINFAYFQRVILRFILPIPDI
nr:MAG TPA: hypothetical protein [Crassvirales sp.]